MIKINPDLFKKYKTVIFVESKDVNDGYPSLVYYFKNGNYLTQVYKITAKSNLKQELKNIDFEGARNILAGNILATYHNNDTHKNRNWKLYGSNKTLKVDGGNLEKPLLNNNDYVVIADSKHFKPKEQLDNLHYKNYLNTIKTPYTKHEINDRKIKLKRV